VVHLVKVPKKCPFPTIVENAIKRSSREEYGFDPIDIILPTDKPGDVPKLTKRSKDEIMKLKMYNFMLRRRNEALSNKIIEYERVIQCLKEDNSILRSLVRKLKNELKKK
jgi:hypothetical protein